MESELVELDHAIGYNGHYLNTLHYHPTNKDTIVYNVGGLIIVENIQNKHNQIFLRGHDMPISTLIISNSGKMIASGQVGTSFQKIPEAPVILWDYEQRKPIFVLKGLKGSVKFLAFSPDDRFLAAYGKTSSHNCVGENNTMIIWDCRDGSAIHTRMHEFPLNLLQWGPTFSNSNEKHPSYIFVTSNGKDVFISTFEFDIASMQYFVKQGKCQLPSTGLNRQYTFSVVVGEYLYAGTMGGEICLFHLYPRIYKGAIPIASNGLLSIAESDEYLFTGGGDGKLKKILAGGATGWQIEAEVQLNGKIVSLSLDIEKKELIVGTSEGKIYRVLTNDLSYLLYTDAHTNCITDVCFCPGINERFATIDQSGCLKLWDIGEYKALFSVYAPGKPSGNCVSIEPLMTGNSLDLLILTGWSDGFMRAYETSGNMIWHVPNAHKGAVSTIYVDPNYILSGGDDGQVRLWSRSTHQLLLQLSGHAKTVSKLFPDLIKPHLVHSCGMDKALCTFDLKLERKVNGHFIKNGIIFDMSQRKDHENELVTCGSGSPIYFWDCDEIDPVAIIEYPYKVSTIEVSPKGKYLAFGTETNEIFIYDISNPKKFQFIAKGMAQSAPIMRVKWSPDEKQIISVSGDATICVWNFYG